MYQFGGVATRRDWRTVGSEDISSTAYIEVGSFSASSSLPTVRHAENHGQRRDVLRSTRSLHIYFQVFYTFRGVFRGRGVAPALWR